MDPIPNIGWLFYKDYYRELEPTLKKSSGLVRVKDLKLNLDSKNEAITKQMLNKHQTDLFDTKTIANVTTFKVTTQYPGLMAGLGTQHNIGHEEELKLGFSFDHTTGLPYIPGSTVKGILRSFFPSRLKAAANNYNEGSPERIALEEKATQLYKLMTGYLFPESKVTIDLDENELLKLEKDIFEGISSASVDKNTAHDNLSPYDVFFDAFPCNSNFTGYETKENGRFLGLDAITPHGKNPLKNPIPLRLLKVLPEVQFQFQFWLNDSNIEEKLISKGDKEKLFKYILTKFGVGAKTNVGYGRVKESEETSEK